MDRRRLAILFSHPKDFYSGMNTELGYMAGLEPDFKKRNTKIIGLSVDSSSNHGKWVGRHRRDAGHKVNYPMIGDPTLAIAKLYDMLPADAVRPPRAARRQQCDCSHCVRGRSGQEDQDDARLPMSTGRNFERNPARDRFPANHRQDGRVDFGELEARRGRRHPAAMPRMKQQKFPGGWKTLRPYLRLGSAAEVTGDAAPAAS